MTIFLFLFVVLFLSMTALHLTRSTKSVPVKPDRPLATFILPDDYVFRQDDPQWSSHLIGPTTDTMGGYGCTISAVAMAASNLTGSSITPDVLEDKLAEYAGFTDRGWLVWSAIPKATGGKVQARVFRQPAHTHIMSCMDKGKYPIVKILLGRSVVHWVLIVGTTQNDYLIRDPLSGNADDHPIILSSRSETIESLRCLELVP